MAIEQTNSFKFYSNFLDAIDVLPEEERARACYEFCKYGVTGELPDDKSLAMFCIGVSVSVQKYQGRGGNHNPDGNNQWSKRSKRSKVVKEDKGGQRGQRGQNEQTETKTETKTKNIIPSLQDVIMYCQERTNGVDANKWFDYYTSNGWKVGKNPMKDWKACVRNWERSNNAIQKQSTWDKNKQTIQQMMLKGDM